MLFPRPTPPNPQCSKRPRAKLRRAGALGAALASAALVVSACDIQPPEAGDGALAPDARELIVTSTFNAPSPIAELAFLPNSDAPWTGLLAAGLTSGGFDVFNVDGQRVISASGPRLRALVGVSDFPLRGETIPLLFGLDDDGALRGFAVLRQAADIVELPLEGFDGAAAGLCFYDEGIGFFDLALLSEGAQARIVRISDTGSAGLTVAEQFDVDLPFPARACAAAQEDLLVSEPNAGLARITPQGAVQARLNGVSGIDVAFTELLGRPTALTVSNRTGRLTALDASTLGVITDLQTVAGLNTAPFETPVALALTGANYGGMAFSTGLVAVYDRDDESIKLVAREVVARAVVASTG